MKNNSISEEFLQIANKMLAKGQQELARIKFQKILEDDNQFHPAIFGLGTIEYSKSNFDNALAYCDKAISIKNDNAIYHGFRGSILRSMGLHEMSIAAHRRAIEIDNENLDLYYNFCNALFDAMKYEDLFLFADRAIEISKELRFFNLKVQAWRKTLNYKELITNLPHITQSFPEYITGYEILLEAYVSTHKYEQGIEVIKKLILLNPNIYQLYDNACLLFYLSNELTTALQYCKNSIELNKNNKRAYYNKGLCLKKLNFYHDSIASLEYAIQLDDKYADAYYELGNIYHQLRDIDSSKKFYEKCLEVHPDHEGAKVNYKNFLEHQFLLEKWNVCNDKCHIVVCGDSHIEFCPWGSLFPNITIANRGRSGDRSEDVINRLNCIVNLQPKFVFLWFGIGDFIDQSSSVEHVFNNYKNILCFFQKKQIKVFVISTLKCNEDIAGIKFHGINSLIDKLNINVMNLLNINSCEFNLQSAALFINANEYLSASNNLIAEYTDDGIHLNSKGYHIFASILNKYINICNDSTIL